MPDQPTAERPRRPWLAIVLVVLLVGSGLAVVLLGRHGSDAIDRRTTELVASARRSFAGTTLDQVYVLNRRAVFEGDPGDDLGRFLSRPGQKPVVFLRLGRTFVARYQATAEGRHRTVEVTWSASGVRVAAT